ncbi:MAG TPA: helix-turn-helix transcriptional regulator [Spirochaetia bacterium]|nr:helix-turn-helix transcriptional regulator [Spirochaetia bacterium]
MSGTERIPWPKLRDYLLCVSTCRTLEECMRAAVVGMHAVIPFDETTGIFRTSDNFNLAGIGHDDACTSAYNAYYRKVRPRTPQRLIDWYRLDGEFVRDFALPYGHYRACRSAAAGRATWMAVIRSRLGPKFTETDAETLGFIDDYLNHLFSSFDKGPVAGPGLRGPEIAQRFDVLTRREAEICALVASRLNTAEIAARLFLSPRTVENHLASVFDKLDVRSREQLRYRLGVLIP